MRYGPLLNTVGNAASYHMKNSSPKQNMRTTRVDILLAEVTAKKKNFVSTNIAASSYSSVRSLRLVALLDPLIERLQNSGIHSRNHVNGGVQFFLGHPCFPCVRKTAIHSRIAQAHHRYG